MKPKIMPITLIKIVLFSKTAYLFILNFKRMWTNLIQLFFLLLNIFLTKISIIITNIWFLYSYRLYNCLLFKFSFNFSNQLQKRLRLWERWRSLQLRFWWLYDIISLQELSLEYLKCMDDWFIVLFKRL